MRSKSIDTAWERGQAPQGIVTIGAPSFKRKTQIVRRRDRKTVQEVASRMIRKLRDLQGQGLAGPQVDSKFRVVVIETRPKKLAPDVEPSELLVMVNPEIVRRSRRKKDRYEGCYSIPGMMGNVSRHVEIDVVYLDLAGQRFFKTFRGYFARVVQHEIDHLDGMTWMDRLEGRSVKHVTTVVNFKRHIL